MLLLRKGYEWMIQNSLNCLELHERKTVDKSYARTMVETNLSCFLSYKNAKIIKKEINKYIKFLHIKIKPCK